MPCPGVDTTCGNNWVCEHRWRQIKNMIIFRNVVDGQAFINWWDNGKKQIALGRGDKGFIVFNNDDWNVDVTLNTGLPPGTYCDISPPNENIVVTNPYRPWWERYQPISYKLCTRSGNEQQFRDMVTRCNNVGVYIYVDAIINHMCGSGGGAGTHSTCGSYFNAGSRDFPVPYSNLDFNDGKCRTGSGEIENYGDANQVRNCRLVGLLDLAMEKDYVRGKIAEYMNNLINIGVAGFRLDAAKHMWPGDLKAISDRLNNLNTKWFPAGARPFIFQECINSKDRGTNLYKMGVGFMLAHPYGFTRVMSSYRWSRNISNGKDQNDWIGPPTNSDGSIKSVPINADATCGDNWVCEHRWRQIKNMVIFRNVANGQPFSNWWDNGSNQVAFGRGNKGFIVFNNDDRYMDTTLNTGLPSGTYCDVISGQKEGSRCTGRQINVDGNGFARFQISNTDEDPFAAIHVNAKL
ncbi:hypothetical protein XELAEV_18025480mg [Xenopus laevis]|uniref:Alpha-amylase n=1 Tax=Xenopus laevis TaxID=8355 RepID=A0A974D1S7_XENLA|nr:hypothetical protein XELAEV_18025480mg [Xenopus laevis]